MPKLLLQPESILGCFTYVGDTVKVSKSSQVKLPFRCSCGNVKNISMSTVYYGRAKTCGECSRITLTQGSEYHGFTYLGESCVEYPGTTRKLLFRCRCGKEKILPVQQITIGHTKTCGECGYLIIRPGDKFNDLTYLGSEISIGVRSVKKLDFLCRCGITKRIRADRVFYENQRNCSSCSRLTLEYGQEYGFFTYIGDSAITSPWSGCTTKKISIPNLEIADFIRSLGFEVEMEFDLDGKKFDICVPSRKLLVEFNGIRWHSKRSSKLNDIEKYRLAKLNGYSEIMVFEDEWKNKRSVVEDILRTRLGCTYEIKPLRTKNCDIRLVDSTEVRELYDRYHYIGSCNSTFNYGIFYDGVLIGGMSFRKPSRQTVKYDFEISRMVMNPGYRVHGVWSHILKRFIQENQPSSLVSYSDNRVFTGSVYERMGFTCAGEVKSDYYWTKGDRRYHKSGLRKPKNHQKSESSLREHQGYSKIWDLGKKRWVLLCYR